MLLLSVRTTDADLALLDTTWQSNCKACSRMQQMPPQLSWLVYGTIALTACVRFSVDKMLPADPQVPYCYLGDAMWCKLWCSNTCAITCLHKMDLRATPLLTRAYLPRALNRDGQDTQQIIATCIIDLPQAQASPLPGGVAITWSYLLGN